MIVLYYIHFYSILGGSLFINFVNFCSVYFIYLITVVGMNKLFFYGLVCSSHINLWGLKEYSDI